MTRRFKLVDLHAKVARDLRPRSTSINPRYLVIDTCDGSTYDAFSTRKPAADTVRDLNRGAYGPLAEVLDAS